MSARKKAADGYQRGNLEAARIIATDLGKDLADSLPAVWAALVLAGAAERPEDAEAGPLFSGRAA